MKSGAPERLLPVIDRKLATLVRSLPATPVWHEAWSRLGPQSTHEERLKVCQAIRDAGTLPEDEGYFLVCWALEQIADEEDARLDDPLETLNLHEMVRTSYRNFPALLERYGEGLMAAQFRTDLEGHDRRREAGRLFFFGPYELEDDEVDPPGWLDGLLRAVAARLVASQPVDRLAYRYEPGGFVRVLHVCLPAGVVGLGGAGWAVDVERLREVFEEIESCGWYVAPTGEGESPYLWVEGKFGGRDVFLRLLAAADARTVEGYQTWKRTSP